MAFLIDYVVVPIGGGLIAAPGFWLVTQGDEVNDCRAAGGSLYFGLGLFPFVYLVVMTRLWGQTLGKMALGIIVVDANGNIPGIAQVIVREVVGKIISFLPFCTGFLWAGWNSRANRQLGEIRLRW